MGFYLWANQKRNKRVIASALATLVFGIGIYYEATATAVAGTFVNEAQSGNNFGSDLLLGGQTDASSGVGQQAIQGFAGMNPTSADESASQYYISDNVGLSSGSDLNKAVSANSTLLSDTTCPSGWPTPLTDFQTDAGGAVQQAQTDCQSAFEKENTSISKAETASTNENNASFTTAQASINDLGVALANVKTAIETMGTECAPNIGGNTMYAPACNLLTQSGTPSLSTLTNDWDTALDNISQVCQDLPTNITSSQDAETLTSDIDPAVSEADGLLGTNTNSVSVGTNGSLSVGSDSSAGTAYSTMYQTILGQCNYAQAYLQSMDPYPQGMNEYSNNPLLNNFLSNQANQGMINTMMPFIEANPEVFKQYYQNVSCTESDTSIPNTGTTVTTPSTTTTTTTTESDPAVCTESLSQYSGWINNADWPDSSANWIYGTSGSCGSGVPAGDSVMMEGTYSNTTGAEISATLYLAANNDGQVAINGTQVASYSASSGETGEQAYSSTGGVVSVPVTLPAGPDEIQFYLTNNNSTTSSYPSAGILTIIGAVNGQNQVLIDTNDNWFYTPSSSSTSVTSATTSVTGVTTSAGQPVTTTAPSTQADSTLCDGPIQCMGTQCHALLDNQDLYFSTALTALSALQQMEQDMQCASGTSIAAGNCQPIIFQGKADYCRTWPFGGTFTNNCCKEGLSAASGGPNLGQYLELGENAWSMANNSDFDSLVFGSKAISPDGFLFGKGSWYESAYSQFDTWASDGWQYVTGAFKGAAEAVENAFGVGGASAGAQLGGDVAKAADDAASASGAASKGLISGLESQVEGWLKNEATQILTNLFGQNMANQIMSTITGTIIPFVGWIMLAYEVFQILQIIAEILTSCKKEEFKLGEKRKVHDCQNLGTYCTEKFLGFCMEHKDVFCCYGSPLDRIIASQIKIGQPNVAGGYGTPKKPDCSGFTPQQLEDVDWSDVSLSSWEALLQKSGLIAGGNAAGSAMYTPGQIDHPNGDVNADLAPQPVEE